MEAFDPDFQLNGIVVYTFNNFTSTNGPFQIDRENGEIRVRSGMEGRLDRETTATYDVSGVSEYACLMAVLNSLIISIYTADCGC